MSTLLLLVWLAQPQACPSDATTVASAAERAALFDSAGALAVLARAPSACLESQIAGWYLRGWIAARDAYRYGGSPESLQPVKTAIDELDGRTATSASAEIAKVVLMAASAAAQSEREEMGLLLEHARSLEARQRAVDAPGLPLSTVDEVAGDLWLQVHRFADARVSYERASEVAGPTPRVSLGLARVAVRIADITGACSAYQALVSGRRAPAATSPEVAEARTFLRRPECRASRTAPRQP
jgi:hypothetical protein